MHLGRTAKAVEIKASKLTLPSVVAPKLSDAEGHWRRKAEQLQAQIDRGQREATAAEVLCEIARELAPNSYETAPPIPKSTKKGKSSQDAVLMLSDTHIGQVVTPEQTLNLGNYNFDVFLRRLAHLERTVCSILTDHTTTQVSEIHVAMLGDMLHGNLVHSVEAGQKSTLFEQFFSAGHALAQFLRNLSSIARVRVHTAVGNHPRWAGLQRKMPTDNVYSNLDQFLYAYVAALLKDNTRVYLPLHKQPFAKFEVCGYRFLATHGTHLRGGDRMLGVPAHAIGRNVSSHSQLAARSGEKPAHYYLVGHLHRPMELPHALGEFLVNGAFAGIDGYALAEAFNTAVPSQKFFLVHPKFGRTACYDIQLARGDATPYHYTIPDTFCCE